MSAHLAPTPFQTALKAMAVALEARRIDDDEFGRLAVAAERYLAQECVRVSSSVHPVLVGLIADVGQCFQDGAEDAGGGVAHLAANELFQFLSPKMQALFRGQGFEEGPQVLLAKVSILVLSDWNPPTPWYAMVPGTGRGAGH